MKHLEIFHLCISKSIDRLLSVSYKGQIGMQRVKQKFYELQLSAVCILKLVYNYLLKILLIICTHSLILFKNPYSFVYQIVKIRNILIFKFCLIKQVNSRNDLCQHNLQLVYRCDIFGKSLRHVVLYCFSLSKFIQNQLFFCNRVKSLFIQHERIVSIFFKVLPPVKSVILFCLKLKRSALNAL